MTHELNTDQSLAIFAMENFLRSGDSFFLLSGSAGTGKTFCIKQLIERARGRFVFTAPTNKATKVLRKSVESPDYRPEARTIYSLLGLRLEANGELRELTVPEDPIDLSKYAAVVVDEASMVNETLFKFIELTVEQFHVKFIFLGDPAQLPPVGEQASAIWKHTEWPQAKLTKVMRHDNQILDLAVHLRGLVEKPFGPMRLPFANNGQGGVWKLSAPAMRERIRVFAEAGEFLAPDRAKAIAWRNVVVDELNAFIRKTMFLDAAGKRFLPTDRVLFTGPAKDLEDKVIATTDDEGTVNRIEIEQHPVYPEFKIWRLSIQIDEGELVTARVLHEDSQFAFAARVDELSREARANGRKWKDFWAFKESFHGVRHAYAITAHRSQGSTYDTTFVEWWDIMLNGNRSEALRCLYVACTRAKTNLILGG